MSYEEFRAFSVEVADGVARLTILPRHDEQERRLLHEEIGQIWRVLDRDNEVRSVLITGVGDEFYFSGNPSQRAATILRDGDRERVWETVLTADREVNDIVYEMVNFSKPLVSAINGRTGGAGTTVALLADIAVASENATFWDPHTMLGVAAGGGALAVWPLLVGLAKTKLYVLTSDVLDGREAERIGLVGRCVPAAQLQDTAERYAQLFADGPPVALRFTKRALNQWLRLSGIVSYDYSRALEAASLLGPEVPHMPWTAWPPATATEREASETRRPPSRSQEEQ